MGGQDSVWGCESEGGCSGRVDWQVWGGGWCRGYIVWEWGCPGGFGICEFVDDHEARALYGERDDVLSGGATVLL